MSLQLLKYNFFNDITEKFIQGAEIKQPFIVSGKTTPNITGYTNISSIVNWDKYGPNLIGGFFGFKDWKKLRSEIKTLVNNIISTGITGTSITDVRNYWDSLSSGNQTIVRNDFINKLSNIEKIIASKYFIVPTDLQLLVDPNLNNWIKIGIGFFDKNSIQSRQQRLGFAISETKNRISRLDALNIQRELNQITQGTLVVLDAQNKLLNALRGLNMIGSYATEGVEGTIEDGDSNAIGILDYILARDVFGGGGASTKGIKNKTLTVKEMPGGASELADKLYDIIANGDY